jgi:hypothetical protein
MIRIADPCLHNLSKARAFDVDHCDGMLQCTHALLKGDPLPVKRTTEAGSPEVDRSGSLADQLDLDP